MPLENGKKRLMFFSSVGGTILLLRSVVISREARPCLFRKGKKTVLPVWFLCEKSSSKPINMVSNFEDLDARNPTVKTVRDLDARLKR